MRATDTGQVGMFAHSLPQRSNLSALTALLDGTAASTHTAKKQAEIHSTLLFHSLGEKKNRNKAEKK